MLIKNGDTDIGTIEEIMALFDEYDKDGNGKIELTELTEKTLKKQKELQQQIENEEKKKEITK